MLSESQTVSGAGRAATTSRTLAGAHWGARLRPFLRERRAALGLAVGLAVAGQALMAFLPLLSKIVLDDAIIGQRRPLWPWLGLLLAVGTSGLGLHYLRRYTAARVSLDIQHDLRLAIHRKVNELDMTRHDALSAGDVMSRSLGDVTLVQLFINQIPLLAANLTLLGVGTAIMVALSPALSLVFVLFVPLFMLVAARFRRRVFPSSWNDQRLAGAVAGVVDEAIAGVRVVKAFAQEERELGRLVDSARELFASRLRTARLTALYASTLQAVPTLAQLGVLLFGGWLAIEGHITLGVFLAFSSYLVQLVAPVRLLSGMVSNAEHARAGAERILDFLELEPALRDSPDAAPAGARSGVIELEHVTFGHARRGPVLRDVSLRIEAGERVAIVGGSGSGKTTLALLIARFYDPQIGVVRLDGRELRDYPLRSVRESVGLVFEESFLFSSTIRANIAFGRPDASQAEIEAAARVAQAHDFIQALPEGYATRVGERGYTLSGGQRQRIALARTALMKPTVLLLDDATSALDARTERALHHSLEETLGRRTTLLIAHRQSTLRLASRVLVLDDGRIVAEGTHEGLSESCPLYRELLTGPDLEDDVELELVGSRAVDPLAWPGVPTGHGQATASTAATLDMVSAKVMSAGGGGGDFKDVGGRRAAFVPATPELLARVATLPPLVDKPRVDLASVTAPEAALSFRRLVRPFRGALLIGLGLVLVDAATTLSGPWLFGMAVEKGIGQGSLRALLWIAAVFAMAQLLSWVNARAMHLQTARTAESLLFSLRARTFAHLQRLSLDFYDRELGGRIMTRMTTDVEAFAQLLQQGLLTAVVALLGCSGVLVLLFELDARLALGVSLVLPPLVAGTLLFRRWSQRAYLGARERISALNAEMQESLSGVRVTQACGQESHGHARYERLSVAYRDARLRSMHLIAVYFPFLQLLSVVAKTITLASAGSLVAQGQLSAGVLVAFLLYLDQFFSPLQQLSNVFDQSLQAKVSLARIRELLASRTRTPEPERPRVVPRLAGELRFEDVCFAYSAGRTALSRVNLHVKPGETVALVGTTGAGKSTLVKLVARFYEASAGRISIDGMPITELELSSYRRQLGYVPQEAFLFAGNIRSNIAYGRPAASDLAVERAARAVGSHTFITSLPQGYLTPVSQGGRSLSAGERQLLCLARAALVAPSILLLDEATSNLDLATEARVQRAMRSVARGRTTLLIAHRLQTARAAQRILVFEDGKIVEDGSHAELVAAAGRYAELWRSFEQGESGAARATATA